MHRWEISWEGRSESDYKSEIGGRAHYKHCFQSGSPRWWLAPPTHTISPGTSPALCIIQLVSNLLVWIPVGWEAPRTWSSLPWEEIRSTHAAYLVPLTLQGAPLWSGAYLQVFAWREVMKNQYQSGQVSLEAEIILQASQSRCRAILGQQSLWRGGSTTSPHNKAAA